MRLLLSFSFLARSSSRLLRVPSRVILQRPAIGQDRVKHMTSHCDDKTDRNGNQFVFPPQGIVHGLAFGVTRGCNCAPAASKRRRQV